MSDLNIIKPKRIQGIINKFCYTLGIIPTSYKLSLTYEEQILAIGQYLEENIYPAINNNAEALAELQNLFLELKDYVENYFNDLDVQEEINNKLDEMADSGELAEIIAQYVQSNAVFGFNNNSELGLAENLINGSFAKTFGKLTYNDGKGAFYKIRTRTNADVPDDDNIIALINTENLVAEKMPDFEINQLKNEINITHDIFQSINHNNPIYSYAWRGLSTEAPENSLPAIVKAGKMDCYGVELDVQTTSDAEIILMHDTTVDRMTDGTGTVNELTYSYISSLTIDEGAFHQYYSGTFAKVPRLTDILYICRMYNLHIMLDLKGYWNETSLTTLLNILSENNVLKYTSIQAYNANYLQLIRQLNKYIKICYIIERTPTSEDIQFAIENKPSMFNIASQSDTYVLPTDTRNLLIENNIEFGFAVPMTTLETRNFCLRNHALNFFISKFGIPRTKNQSFKNIEAFIQSDGTIVPRFAGETQDNSLTLNYAGFTCALGTNNLYTITYATPFFVRFNEYSANVICGGIYSSSNVAGSAKYKILTTALSEGSFGFRIVNTATNQVVNAQTVYNDIGNARIQFLCAGDMI